MFDLEKKKDGLPEPSREDLKEYRHREHNKRQKTMMKVVGENLASYACVLILILLVGLIWTDIGINLDLTSFLTDSLITVVLFILADVCMAQIGTKGGRLDDDYVKIHEEYLTLRERVRKLGLSKMDMFCDWQIDVEYEFYIRKQLKKLKIGYNDYNDKYSDKTLEELKTLLPLDQAVKVYALGQSERIELTPDILMTDGRIKGERRGIPISGEEYIEKHTTSWHHILLTAVFAIVAAVPLFSLTDDISVGRVIYTIFKLAMMFYRMYTGYSRGSKGYNTVEPKHLEAKIKYLYLYIEFLQERIYLTLAEKYNVITEGKRDDEDQRKDETDASGAGGYPAELGDHENSV